MLHHFCHHYVYYPNRALLTEMHVRAEVGGLSLFFFSSRRTSKQLVPLISRYIKINHIISPTSDSYLASQDLHCTWRQLRVSSHCYLNTNDICRDECRI